MFCTGRATMQASNLFKDFIYVLTLRQIRLQNITLQIMNMNREKNNNSNRELKSVQRCCCNGDGKKCQSFITYLTTESCSISISHFTLNERSESCLRARKSTHSRIVCVTHELDMKEHTLSVSLINDKKYVIKSTAIASEWSCAG